MSWQTGAPTVTATISFAFPASLSRTASSTAISQKGFMAILTLAVSTPDPSLLTRARTFASMTRLMETRIFMACPALQRIHAPPGDGNLASKNRIKYAPVMAS